MEKKQYYENIINDKLKKELIKLKEITSRVESLVNSNAIDIDLKAIRVFETMQNIKFDSYIFRDIKEMNKE